MSWKVFVVSALAASVALAGLYVYQKPHSAPGSYAHFSYFMQNYDRNYSSPQQIESRFAVFKQNLLYFAEFKAQKRRYAIGVGPFADMSFEEFKQTWLMKPVPNRVRRTTAAVSMYAEEVHIDWLKEGKVSEVKNQGQCGSCWAFAAIGGLESAHAIQTGEITLYSEQELLDCSGRYGNHACEGGIPSFAYDYIQKRGICLGNEYPYTARKGKCTEKGHEKQARISGYEKLGEYNPDAFIAMLGKNPVVIALEVQGDFMHYRSGIFDGSEECGAGLNHAVLITGVKISASEKYFMLKNSWGTAWGEKGYMRIGFGKENTGVCGMINEMAVIPQLERLAGK